MKAVPFEWQPMTKVTGYVTIEKSLIGRTPRQLEDDLGLPAGRFAMGCRIYRLTRLPMTSEIEYELTLDNPDGLAFDEWGALNQVLMSRLDSSRPKPAIYGPGRSSIHQWRLTVDVSAALVCDLLPGVSFLYPKF